MHPLSPITEHTHTRIQLNNEIQQLLREQTVEQVTILLWEALNLLSQLSFDMEELNFMI